MSLPSSTDPVWAQDVGRGLKDSGIQMVCYLPDSVTERVHAALKGDVQTVRLNREEEGVGIIAGAWLAGVKGCLLMQNTGLASCYNSLLSLLVVLRIPCLLIVSLRGELGEFNPAQVPVGVSTESMIEAAGLTRIRLAPTMDVYNVVMAAAALAESSSLPLVLLLPTELTGGKRGPN